MTAHLSPGKQAYSKAAFKAGQPWFSVGLLLLSLGILAVAATANHLIALWLRVPSIGLDVVGLGVEAYGVVLISRWKKANPISQFDQGARS